MATDYSPLQMTVQDAVVSPEPGCFYRSGRTVPGDQLPLKWKGPTKFWLTPHSSSTPGESPAGSTHPGLSLSPLIRYRNLEDPHFSHPCESMPFLWVSTGFRGCRITWKFQWILSHSKTWEALIQKDQKDFWDPRLGTEILLQANAGCRDIWDQSYNFRNQWKKNKLNAVSRKKEWQKLEWKWSRMERQQIKLRKVVEWINKIEKPIARWTGKSDA